MSAVGHEVTKEVTELVTFSPPSRSRGHEGPIRQSVTHFVTYSAKDEVTEKVTKQRDPLSGPEPSACGSGLRPSSLRATRLRDTSAFDAASLEAS